jgi:GT2 family glycosyltransferase
MFVRSDLFLKFDGFDADFFAHMEEIDLCWRFKNAGYRIMYSPKSKVYHVGGGTLPKISWRKTYLNFRNNIVLIYKNLPLYKLLPVLLVRFVLDGIAGLKFFFEGDYKDCYAVVKAHFYFYKTFRRQRAKRKKITYNLNVTRIYRRSIVLDYYLFRKRKFSDLEF